MYCADAKKPYPFGFRKSLGRSDQALKELNEGKTSRMSSGSHWIEELFDLLRRRSDLDLAELARRE